MSFSELLGNVGSFGAAVMICLALLSIFSVGMILDKHRRFRMASRQSQAFKPVFNQGLRAGQLKEVIEAAQKHPESHVAQVVSAGLLEYEASRQTVQDATARFELVNSELEHSKVETLIKMKRGLGVLATIGSTAPFIGLFGTVVGIISAFRGIAATGSGGMAAVSGGIAEALVATALGILVAIPAVVAYNLFSGRLEQFQVEINKASSDLENYLFKVPVSDAMRRNGDSAKSATASGKVAHAAQ
jgi:biopolymer transport protein ExbB/TolQ